jgi:Protein of unknown function DUF262
MKVDESKYSIAEIVAWYRAKELVVNKEYQRGGGLWPSAAKSYFIDTILREFPFPKIYFHERVDMVTKRPRREIVDGQQRISTIASFVSNEFALGRNAREYDGKHFDDLDDEVKENFWSYAVAVDVIRNADRPEILQMFRRMNAFTLPLNEAEKRHSEFFGEFKDWVNLALDTFGSLLIDWDVLTSRQVVRMADAEFVADLALAVEEGIVSTSPTKLRALYKKYDKTFDQEAIKERISGVHGQAACIPFSDLCADTQSIWANRRCGPFGHAANRGFPFWRGTRCGLAQIACCCLRREGPNEVPGVCAGGLRRR